MLYVGKGLRAVNGMGSSMLEPALINPELRVGSSPNHEGKGMGYWPSYSGITPECRAAYLDWLKGGRQDPSAYIGYVFLFFYGLERRALVDLPGGKGERAEWNLIGREVDRLLAVYGDNNSFRGYATAFRGALAMLQGASGGEVHLEEGFLDTGRPSLATLYAVSRCVREGTPLPPQLALSWALGARETPLRTPATRCPREFRELFHVRYAKTFGNGLIVPPRKAVFKATYHPASASFGGAVSLPMGELPQPSTQPLRRLQDLIEECTQELDAYSRWLGRNAEKGAGLAAAALLPPELAMSLPGEEIQALRRWLDEKLGKEEYAPVEGGDLLRHLASATPGKLNKNEAVLLTQSLEKLGFAVEPDVRFGGAAPAVDERVVIFKVGADAPATPSVAYAAATTMLHLAAIVAFADGSLAESEQRRLEEHLETALELTPGERTRLRAHLRWLLTSRPGLTGMKKRLASLAPPVKSALGQFIISVAAADGHVSADELKTLAKIYPLLGLDPDELYSHVHAVGASSQPPPATEPVTVRTASRKPKGFGIPPRPPEAPAGVSLDMASVQAKLAETAAVSSLLGGIFVEDEAPASAPPTVPVGKQVPGLDAAHSALLRSLAERHSWPRVDFEQLTAKLGLLPDGALDALNEAALDACGEVVWEGEDPIEMNAQTLKELLA